MRYANVSCRFAHIVGRLIKRQRKAKVEPIQAFRLHDLRHCYAVDYLRAGGSIYDLQQNLGHTSIETTGTYLGHLTPGRG